VARRLPGGFTAGRGELNEAEERRDYYHKKINRYLFIGPCVSQNNFGQK
jgi:hypothetical protein